MNIVSITEGLGTEPRLSVGVFSMLGIVTGWEREGIVERINAGMHRAKLRGTRSGKPIGRPKKPIDEALLQRILSSEPGISQKRLAEKLGVPRTTLQGYLKANYRSDEQRLIRT